MRNLEAIHELNKNVGNDEENARGDHPVYGINQFFDLTPKEFKDRFLLRDNALAGMVEAMRQDNTHDNLEEEEERHVEARAIPTAFDWRNHNKMVVTRVYDQGACGSCWAWSVVMNVESMWALAGNPLPALSAQQMVDCSTNNNGCGGGCK